MQTKAERSERENLKREKKRPEHPRDVVQTKSLNKYN